MKNWDKLEADINLILDKHFTGGRDGRKVDKVVLHHNGGNLTGQGCYTVWQTRQASATTSRQPSASRKRTRPSPTRAQESDMSSPAWLTIIVSIITACGGGIVGWATKRFDAGWATKADIDRLAGEIAKLDVQLAKVCSKLDNDNRRLNSIEQSAMRSELFAVTQDRTQHEHQLEVGKRYLAAGYNGAGHVRITQLKADYSRRLASDDWDY